ncbi:MAG: hypothetical protein RL154_1572 [Pseudomonadota bacterium]
MQQHLFNLDLERAVLSYILEDSKSFDTAAQYLNSIDFYHPFHKTLFEVFETLNAAQKPIEESFIRPALAKMSQTMDEDGWIDIVSTAPLPHTPQYLELLKDLSVKRQLLGMSSSLRASCENQAVSADEMIENAEKQLFKISSSGQSGDFKDGYTICEKTLTYIQDMKAKGDHLLVGLDTGFYELNKKTAGFGKGDLVIIAARPAMGKTAFALGLAAKTLEHGKGVAIFSLEMPAEQLLLRMLSSKTNIPLQDLRVGNLNDPQWTQLTDAIDYFSSSKLFVDDEGGLSISTLRSKLRRLKTRHPEVEMVLIDYLQLMNGSGGKDRHLEVSEISRGLKLLARELSVPIIALSQLNRTLEARNDKRPMLSDIRESGAIEQDADLILFVYRDDVYKAKEEKEKEKAAQKDGKEYRSEFVEKLEEDAEVIIGKNRNGPTGTVQLVFHKRYTRFVGNDSVQSYEFGGYSQTRGPDIIDMPLIKV